MPPSPESLAAEAGEFVPPSPESLAAEAECTTDVEESDPSEDYEEPIEESPQDVGEGDEQEDASEEYDDDWGEKI